MSDDPSADFPDQDLLALQRALHAAREELSALYAALPQMVEEYPDGAQVKVTALLERQRALAEQIGAHGYWAGIDKAKLVAERAKLMQAALPAEQRYVPAGKGR